MQANTEEAQNVLRIQHLRKYFGTVHAVEDVSLTVNQGEIFGFLGPNGAGKTTTISMILGLTHPTAGAVEVLGQRVTPGTTAVLRRVGMMVGSPSLLMSYSAWRNLQMLSYLYPELSSRRIDEVLEMVNLTASAHRRARTFSTGMKQRLGLAMALLGQPELLILDEPTSGMDPAGMQEVRQLLRTLAQQGITIFLSSHLLHEMELICDRVAVIKQGSIIAQGTVSSLLVGKDIVRVRTSLQDQTIRALAELPGASHITSVGSWIELRGVTSEQTLAFLVKRDLMPQEVTTSSTDLESVFLLLTGQSA
jgi:ABC-type multidrug transport system ATPase subunit